MAYSKIIIANWALEHIGERGTIAAFDEDSPGAMRCNLFMPLAMNTLLEGFDYGFARQAQSLALLDMPDQKHPEYEYTFQYPADCLRARHIGALRGSMSDKFEIGVALDADQNEVKVIRANINPSTLIFTRRLKTTETVSDKFALALSYQLAAFICEPIAGDVGRRDKLLQLAQYHAEEAAVQSANERFAGQELFGDDIEIPTIAARFQ